MGKISIQIAGIKILIISENQDLIEGVKTSYSMFQVCNDQQYYLKINITLDPVLNQENQMQEICLEKDNLIFRLKAADFRSTVNFKTKTIDARISSQAGAVSLFLRVVFSLILLENNGFLIHAAGFCDAQGKSWVFAGPSESGKTTLAKWAAANNYKVLSDELVAIRKIDDQYVLFSTPFNGEYSGQITNFQVDLKNLFFLGQKIKSQCKRLKKLDCFLNLLKNVFFFNRQIQENQLMINLMQELSERVCAYQINLFNQDIERIIHATRSDSNTQQRSSLARG
ncbi:MAG: hypothetical protein ABIG64_04725 [Candidatus Omnitrophota bacterium]